MKDFEWKDTSFSFSLDYHYSLFIRNRCTFFWGLSNHWRKTLNYASKFADDWNVCVVYLYGKPKGKEETISSYIKSLPGNFIVIVFSEITSEQLSLITSEYPNWVKVMCSRGYLTKDGDLTKYYLYQKEQTTKAVETGKLNQNDNLYQQLLYDERMINTYEKVLSDLEVIQKHTALCYSNCININEINPQEKGLISAIKTIFPYGVECNTSDEACVKIASAKRYIRMAQNHEEAMNIKFEGVSEQLSFFDNSTEGASKILSVIKEYCEREISEKGYFYVPAVWFLIAKKPYGAYDCNWYLYIFAYAMSEYYKQPYGICAFHIVEDANKFDFIYSIKHHDYDQVFLPSKNHYELAEMICNLFDIPKEKYISRAVSLAIQWCVENTDTPLSWIDDNFLKLFKFDYSKWCNIKTVDFYHSWISRDFNKLYNRIRSIDDDFDNYLVHKGYSKNKIKLFRKWTYVKGSAVGWLHDIKDFEERVDEYMGKENVCRECGRPIEKYSTYYQNKISDVKDSYTERFDEIIFTEKEIIGLNKKFLGRYQNEYFCIPCLCEILDTTAEELKEKIKQFKKQGCELF